MIPVSLSVKKAYHQEEMQSQDIKDDLIQQLRERVATQLEAEVRHDVEIWYETIDPVIRAARIAERTDEPALTKAVLAEFMAYVHSIKMLNFKVESDPSPAARLGGRIAAVIVSEVLYNESQLSTFRTIWVLDKGRWYTRASGKIFRGEKPEQSKP